MLNRFEKADLLYLKYFLFILLLNCISCARGQDHINNEKWLAEEKIAEQSTVVLNNAGKSVPLTSLEGLKIASINLGFSHAGVFDSLLNKYEKVFNYRFAISWGCKNRV